ncbi:MAG: hypothetical protein Q7U78_13570 [Gallionella sp.]|nr:hypothetical protein [Gallionella sp.]
MKNISKPTPLVLIAALLLMLGCGISTADAGDGWFQEESLRLSNMLVGTLISSKVCVDKNDCVKKQIIFVAGEPWGLDVSIYGVGDGRVLSQLVASCSDMFFNANREMKVKVRITRITKSEEMTRLFWKKRNSIEVVFKGENHVKR